jgi:hypothetical protein
LQPSDERCQIGLSQFWKHFGVDFILAESSLVSLQPQAPQLPRNVRSSQRRCPPPPPQGPRLMLRRRHCRLLTTPAANPAPADRAGATEVDPSHRMTPSAAVDAAATEVSRAPKTATRANAIDRLNSTQTGASGTRRQGPLDRWTGRSWFWIDLRNRCHPRCSMW